MAGARQRRYGTGDLAGGVGGRVFYPKVGDWMMPTVTNGVVTCTAADCLAQADAILREHPVRQVRLTTRMGWDEILKGWKRLLRPMAALPVLSFKEMVGLAWPG